MDVGMKIVKDEQEGKKTLCNEILLRKSMRKIIARKISMYKVNSMTVVQLKVNLGILLPGNHEKDCDVNATFPDVESMVSVPDNSVVELLQQ